uniref:Ribonuclease H-like domain-containing protein n=1 Tax=Tanacetum cinerariifolium TaxID=118510 RepID=A0A699GVW2_TANCI|nr:ribonuclease H-like domain-containing protein [Tanacetum cinerariifolium]
MAGEESSQPPQPSIASTKAPQMVLYVKLTILKKVQMSKDEAGNEIEVPLVTAQQILARTRERKVKSTLVMAISDKHLTRFHGIKDAKTLWAAIKTRFCGNVESKKMQKNVLKQQFEFFSVSNLEGLDKGYNRFQRLLNLLEIHGACVSTKDANQKLLRSLPSAWSNISLIMRNNPGIDTLDIDDLTSSTNELNAAYSVSTATCHSSQTQGSSSYDDELMFLFFANQSNTPQLNKEDLEQIDQDDFEELAFKWQVAMLSMTVKQFYKKIRRKLEINGKEPVSFDKNKVECVNCHKRGHFARDCRSAKNSRNMSRDVGNAGYRERDNEEEAFDFALMAFTSNPSSSSSSNFELDEALKEKEDLKAKLEKFETSSKNLTKLLDSQISIEVKTGLGYDSQFNEKEVLDIKEEEVTETVFDNRSSDEENSVANDRFKKGEGYHAVPPPLTGNYMPPKPDLSFAGLDDSIYKFKISETVTSLAKDENNTPETSIAFIEKPKEDRMAKKSVLPTNVGKGTGHRESRPVWNNVQRINHQNKFSPTAVFTRSSRIPLSAAKPKAATSTSAAKPVNTVGPKQSVNFSRSTSTFHKLHSPTRRDLDEFCEMQGIKREYSNAKTPQHNGVAERKNRTLIRAARTLLADSLLPIIFWAEVVILNRALVTKTQNKTPYELLNGKEVFDQHYIVLSLWSSISSTYKSSDDKPADDKPKDDTGSKTVEEPVNKDGQAYRDKLDMLMSLEKEASDAANALRKDNPVNAASTSGTFSTDGPSSFHLDVFIPANTLLHVDQDDSQIPNLEDIVELQSTGIFNSAYDDDLDKFNSPIQSVGPEADFNNMESSTILSPIPTHKVHIDHPKDQILGDPKSAVQTRGMAKKNFGAHALMEPKKVSQALNDESWVEEMQEELLNKKDKRGIVVRNKARLVAQGYRQEEGIDYDEVFALVARIEAIMIFLAFASFTGFIVYQMDVKSAFLYGTIEEDVYVNQPPGFIDSQFPNKVYKNLNEFHGGAYIFLRTAASTLIETQKPLVKDEVAADVDVHLYRSMIGSLMYLTASRPDIMFAVCACSRFQVTPKILHLQVVKRIFRYLEGQPKLGLWYLRDSLFDLEAYSDSDYAGANLDRKSTTRGCQFLDRRLISWQCKKQTIVATSTTKAEYVAAAHCYGQFILLDETFTASTIVDVAELKTFSPINLYMVDLKFVDQHNMVAYLEKTEENAEFHHIVDFFSTCSINYALTEGGDSVERAITTDASLVAVQDSDNIAKTQSTTMSIDPISQEFGSGDRPGHQETTLGVQMLILDCVPPTPHDSPLSGGHTPRSDEGRPNINELMNLCTQLSNRVLALEQFKIAQDLVIKRLQKKVNRLEKKQRAGTPGIKLFKIGTSKKKTLDKENDVNAAEPISTAGDAVNAASVIPDVSAVGPSTSTAEDIFEDEMTTIADTLMAIRRTRPRTASVVIHDVKEEPRRATPPPKYKAKTKARTDADVLIAERLQQEEREQFTIDEQAKMLVDLIAKRKSEQQAEGSKKRSRVDYDKESVKKQKLEDDDTEKEELRACLDIVPVDDIAIDVESLATKYPIVD